MTITEVRAFYLQLRDMAIEANHQQSVYITDLWRIWDSALEGREHDAVPRDRAARLRSLTQRLRRDLPHLSASAVVSWVDTYPVTVLEILDA
jgi:hypothetical protein